MRDARRVHRFLFTRNDTLFFEPFDMHYRPGSDHFLAGLDPRVRARFVRSGLRWSHRCDPARPAQGWQIHVSVCGRRVREVAASVIAHLVAHGADFDIVLDPTVHAVLNSRAMPHGSGGELVTVYPRDDARFRACLDGLAGLLEGVEGAHVLSDIRYEEHRALSFRYGPFRDPHTVDVLGRRVAHLTGPDGPVPDDRRPGCARPWWVPWPFSHWKPVDEPTGEELLGGRFRVTGTLRSAHSGGVYTAEDTADGDRTVLLREARPHTGLDPRSAQDAVDVLAREWTVLNRLAGAGPYPAPVAAFRHGEPHYLAQEFVDRADIRSVLREHHPLARPGFDVERSRDFLRLFVRIFRGLTRALATAHERHVTLGDFTAADLLIDPVTHEVGIVGLEACRPDPPGDGGGAGRGGDLRALAHTMAYCVFPIAPMANLRDDALAPYRVVTEALGWPGEIHTLVSGLAEGRIGLADAAGALADEAGLLARVAARSREPVAGERAARERAGAGVAAFVVESADTDRATLFPVDPFAHVTNPLSLGFGAGGVLWALHASGVAVRPEWRAWLAGRLAELDVRAYPDGLMNGLAGIAWAADSLGLRTEARELLHQANRRATAVGDHTFHHGLSGVGMTNLRFYLRERDPRHLVAATQCARVLCDTVLREGHHAYWPGRFSAAGPLTGLGFGQAGVALFLLRMHQVTGDGPYLRLGRDALAWETARARHDGTTDLSVEAGAAGLAQVLLRYGDLDAARTVLRALDVGHAVSPGYASGMSGIADALLDAARFTGERRYREDALRRLDFVRKVFLFEPSERFGVPRRGGVIPLAVPGEGLLRCSCDYLTGSAGVLRVLHRAGHGGTADFLLDEAA